MAIGLTDFPGTSAQWLGQSRICYLLLVFFQKLIALFDALQISGQATPIDFFPKLSLTDTSIRGLSPKLCTIWYSLSRAVTPVSKVVWGALDALQFALVGFCSFQSFHCRDCVLFVRNLVYENEKETDISPVIIEREVLEKCGKVVSLVLRRSMDEAFGRTRRQT